MGAEASLYERARRATHTYLGVRLCGCAPTAVLDTGDRDTARDVAAMIRDGLHVERVPCGDVKARLRSCDAHRAERRARQGSLL